MRNGKQKNTQTQSETTTKADEESTGKISARIELLEAKLIKLEEFQKAYTSHSKKLEDRMGKIDQHLSDRLNYSRGFYDGRRYIIRQAEEILYKNTGCRDREELVASGKLPPFWIATLVQCLDDPPGVDSLTKKRVDNQSATICQENTEYHA